MKLFFDFIEKHKEFTKKTLRFTIIVIAYVLAQCITKIDFSYINTILTGIFGCIIPDFT